MTKVFEVVQVDDTGKITHCEHCQATTLRVMSHEIMPKGCGRGTEAFIIDKIDAAFCDGNDNWYAMGADGGVKTAKAGQPWSALFS